MTISLPIQAPEKLIIYIREPQKFPIYCNNRQNMK